MEVEERRGILAMKSMLRARYHFAEIVSYGDLIPRSRGETDCILLLAIWLCIISLWHASRPPSTSTKKTKTLIIQCHQGVAEGSLPS